MAPLSQQYTKLEWCRKIVLAWCLLPVMKASDLDGFNKRPFSRCHLVTASMQVVNWRVLWPVKIEHKRGPKTGPCGTPVLCVIVIDLLAPMDTKLLRSNKYDFYRKMDWPVKPNRSWACCSNRLWFKVSKPALMSSDNNNDGEPESTLVRRSLTTFVIAVSDST